MVDLNASIIVLLQLYYSEQGIYNRAFTRSSPPYHTHFTSSWDFDRQIIQSRVWSRLVSHHCMSEWNHALHHPGFVRSILLHHLFLNELHLLSLACSSSRCFWALCFMLIYFYFIHSWCHFVNVLGFLLLFFISWEGSLRNRPSVLKTPVDISHVAL